MAPGWCFCILILLSFGAVAFYRDAAQLAAVTLVVEMSCFCFLSFYTCLIMGNGVGINVILLGCIIAYGGPEGASTTLW